MLRVFIGYDDRQPVAYNVLQFSIATRSSRPVTITPLIINQLPIKRTGLTPFTFSRFLVPWLCDYQGTALFLDIDMQAPKSRRPSARARITKACGPNSSAKSMP